MSSVSSSKLSFKDSHLYIIKVRQIKCLDVNKEHVHNLTCFVKAQRHKYGIINLRYNLTFMDEVMVHTRLFYQNSAGKFLPYIIDYQYNACDWGKLLASGSILFTFLRVFDTIDSSATSSCPYNQTMNMMNFDINKFVSNRFPPFVPVGEYKAHVRQYHKTTNKNYITIIARGAVIANGVKGSMADLSMLNMG